MKARLRKGKIIEGRLAETMVSRGLAEPLEASDKKIKLSEAVEMIEKSETVEDLKQFESDTRKGVIKAYEKKLVELNGTN